MILTKSKDARWNKENFTIEPQIGKCPSNEQNVSHDGVKQCEIKISSISTICQDNMTTTDTTGSYVSSASNIDVSSTSLRDEGISIYRVYQKNHYIFDKLTSVRFFRDTYLV